MDQNAKGGSWQQTKTPTSNEQPTYLTKYEQFIANLLPKPYPVENTLNIQQKCVSQNTENKQKYILLQNMETKQMFLLQNMETNENTLSLSKYVLPPSELISNNSKTKPNGAPHILKSILKKPRVTSDAAKKLPITSDVLIKTCDTHSVSPLQSQASPTLESISSSSESHRKRTLTDTATNPDTVSSLITIPPETDNISAEQPITVSEDEPMKAYECRICSFETIYESSFKEHLLTHRKTRKVTFHTCPKCPFRLRCRASVRKHMVVNKKSPNEIAYCGLYAYSSKCKVDLDLHLCEHLSG